MSDRLQDVVIVSAVRTPVGRIRGALSTIRPDDLAATAIKAAIERSGVDPGAIDEVVLGCANQAGEDNRNVARMATLLAGLPDHVPAITMNRLCASGLSAVNNAARMIAIGEADVVVAGGVESMTRAPYSMSKTPVGFGSGNATAWDTTLGWRYPNPRLAERFPLEAMGETAENLVERSAEFGAGPISRKRQDEFAIESQTRAAAAMQSGRFKNEIVPVEIPNRRGPSTVFEVDEHPRVIWDGDKCTVATSLESLEKLRPAFREGGSVTAGNSSGLNDGAAALVVASRELAEKEGWPILVRWVGSASAGVDPTVMGIGPVPATLTLLERFDLTVEDLSLIELNEAFAAQSLAVIDSLGLDTSIVNVNGGAIALGHPLGCSGARILTTLIHEMLKRRTPGDTDQYGLATLCVGVGQGEATLVSGVDQ